MEVVTLRAERAGAKAAALFIEDET